MSESKTPSNFCDCPDCHTVNCRQAIDTDLLLRERDKLETELAAAEAERDRLLNQLRIADAGHSETISNRDNWREIAEWLAEIAGTILKFKDSCEGDIRWRSQPDAVVGYLRVGNILAAERALAAYCKLKEGK